MSQDVTTRAEATGRRSRRAVLIVLVSVTCGLAAGPARAATSLYPDLKTLPPSELRTDTMIVDGQRHHLIRFSNWVWNAGQGPLEVRGTPNGGSTVQQRVYDDAGGYTDYTVSSDLLYHPTHNHFHLQGFAEYELWTKSQFDSWVASGRSVGKARHVGTKTSFCLVDSGLIQALPGSPADRVYTVCDGNVQGISVGYGDYYGWSLPEQWVDVGTSRLPDGTYVLRSIADPVNKLYESAARADASRESPQANEGITEFTIRRGKLSRR